MSMLYSVHSYYALVQNYILATCSACFIKTLLFTQSLSLEYTKIEQAKYGSATRVEYSTNVYMGRLRPSPTPCL